MPNITVFNPSNNSISYITPKSDNILFNTQYLVKMFVLSNELYTYGSGSTIFKSSDIANWKLVSRDNGFGTVSAFIVV